MLNRDSQAVFNQKPFAAGTKKKTPGIRPGLFYTLFTVLAATNMITLVAFLMSSDVTALVAGQSDQTHLAYQDRIAQLRLEVDRLNSRQYAQAGNFNLQLQELAQLQQVLGEQHQYVRTLAAKAEELGLEVATATSAPTPMPPIEAVSISSAAVPDLEDVTQTLDLMISENRMALSALSESASTSTRAITTQLNKIGIATDFLNEGQTAGVGGPFEPLMSDDDIYSLTDEANAVAAAFAKFGTVRAVAARAPIHAPIIAKSRMSSNFGTRRDPFNNKNAFHAGIDFAATRGTSVLSAGDGVVAFAGQRSGYGNVVEIQHSDGLKSRYAHLSKYVVATGDKVSVGTKIGAVGSTGRSTGPHLHFEVRRQDKPLNPARFLEAGNALAKFL